MILLLSLSLFAHATLRDPGSEPGPRSLCRRAEMSSCIEGHRSAKQNELLGISDIDEKLSLLSKDRGAIALEAVALESEIRKAKVTAEMCEREGRDATASPSGDPIFLGGPRAEEIFFLRGEPNSWDEFHSSERIARLNTLAEFSLKKAEQLEPIRRNLAMEIDTLDALSASLLRGREQRVQQVNIHAGMCEHGCKMQFCRDE